MNYTITNIPEREQKPRNNGMTMVMDKGLSLRQVEDFLQLSALHTDIVKLGWATSYVTYVKNFSDKRSSGFASCPRICYPDLYEA